MNEPLLWAWGPSDWERIELAALQARLGVASAALELCQWAALACVRELHHRVEAARAS